MCTLENILYTPYRRVPTPWYITCTVCMDCTHPPEYSVYTMNRLFTSSKIHCVQIVRTLQVPCVHCVWIVHTLQSIQCAQNRDLSNLKNSLRTLCTDCTPPPEYNNILYKK